MTEIYALFKNEEIVYIGRSKNTSKRVKAHRKDKDFDSYMVLCKCSDESEQKVEDMYIKQFDPKYNRALNSSGHYINLTNYCEEYKLPLDFMKYSHIKRGPLFANNYMIRDVYAFQKSYDVAELHDFEEGIY